MLRLRTLAPAALLALAACAADGATSDQIPSFEDYVDGKEDTGYVGTRAAEMEAVLRGEVEVRLPGRSPSELETTAAALRANPNDWNLRTVTGQVTEQIKYARNALKAEKLDLNLEGGAPTFSTVTVIDGGLVLAYELKVESLVKFKELEERGLAPADLVGKVVEPKLPRRPDGLFERIGAACATDPDTGGDVPAADLGAHNLFYYFDPARTGCSLGAADLVTAHYEIRSSLDAPTVYPEYDRLVADGKVTMAVIFGQIEHGELKPGDWGFLSFNTMTRALRNQGFAKVESFPDNRGQKMKKTFPGGLVVEIDLWTPVSFADSVPREEANEKFRAAMRASEIVYYNGHAFYGSLTVLDEPTAYPTDTYQIIFMDACWSYAYYTKQVFRNKATETDPLGWELADVVNNTEPGITGSEETAAILWENVFKGAAAAHSGASSSLYSWNNMIKYMNEHAEWRARQRTSHPDPEIYGASGVRTNRFDPTRGTDPEPPPSGATRYEATPGAAIPDASETGVATTITVPASAGGAAGTVMVDVEIAHSYVGDLTVTLSHGGKTAVLHDRSGGSSDDLHLRAEIGDFDGTPRAGDWVLTVTDTAAADTGTLTSWAVEL
jgi:hypothetical protein